MQFYKKDKYRQQIDWWRSCETFTGVQISNRAPIRCEKRDQNLGVKWFDDVIQVELVNDSLYEWNVKMSRVDPDSLLATDLATLKVFLIWGNLCVLQFGHIESFLIWGNLYLCVTIWPLWRLLPPKLQRRGLVFKRKLVTMERVCWVTIEREEWVSMDPEEWVILFWYMGRTCQFWGLWSRFTGQMVTVVFDDVSIHQYGWII